MNTNAAMRPYRELISAAERAELSRPRPARVVTSIVLLWTQILGSWVIAFWLEAPIAVLAAAAFAGNRYYALFIIGHDGLHRRIHPDVSKNDLINDLFVLGPICAVTRVNRLNHMQHHQTLGLDCDPDRFKYQDRSKLSALELLLSFSGVPLVMRAAANVFMRRPFASAGARPSYRRRDIAVIVSWQAALMLVLTSAFGWWGYLVMWLLPVGIFAIACDLLRVFCEHSLENEQDVSAPDQRLIMIRSSPFERIVFSPMNMNHHVAHHLWPSVPYFNLPRATRMLESRAGAAGLMITQRDGYCRYMLRCLRLARQPHEGHERAGERA